MEGSRVGVVGPASPSPQSSCCIICHFCAVSNSHATLCDPMDCSVPGFPVLHHLLEFAHSRLLNWRCHPTISSSVVPLSSWLQSFPTSGSFLMTQLFTPGGQSLEFHLIFNINPSNERSGLTFRMDWLDLLEVQGTLKSLLQHHGSKSSILWCSVTFMVQLSDPYMTTGKTIALTRQTFARKIMPLFF